MKSMSRAVTALSACGLLILAACGSSGPSTPSSTSSAGGSQNGGNLTFARTTDILTLDPTQMTDNESIWTVEGVYETLYAATPDGRSLVPWLATSYSLSSDHLTWTFHLRHGVEFANGKPMTSADVKFSIARVSAKASNPFAFIDAAIASITTPDKYTVVITTKFPWAPLLADVALFANGVLPDNFGGESQQQFFTHPYGTGPFSVSQWVKGQKLVMVKNNHYWQPGKPKLNSVTFTDVPNDNTRGLELQSGQAQIDEFPPYSSISQLQATTGVKVGIFKSSRTDFLEFNESHKPYQDVHVRRAISYALNRNAMIQAVLFGHGTSANSIISPGLWAYDPASPGIQYNLTQARAEMAKSSVPHGFSTTLLVGSGVTNENSLGQIIQQELKPLGVTVTLRPVDPNSEYTDIQNGQYDMAFNYDTTDIIDPDELISFSAMGGNTGQKTHALFTNYDNTNVDTWAQEAERTFSQASRQALYNKIQEQVANDAVMGYLYFSPFVYAYSTRVHGLDIYPTGNYHLENVWLSS